MRVRGAGRACGRASYSYIRGNGNKCGAFRHGYLLDVVARHSVLLPGILSYKQARLAATKAGSDPLALQNIRLAARWAHVTLGLHIGMLASR